MRYKNGDKFTGKFTLGAPSEGEMLFADMDERYVGQLYKNVQEGQGMMQFFNGEIYNGAWHDGFMHGNGLYSYPDGAEFFGTF